MGKLENKFQADLIKELENLFPGCLILKNDSTYKQGISDLLILWKKHWGMLEVKKSAKAKHRPNQDYYVQMTNDMSFARFIYPENKEQVLHEMESAFKPRRKTRISRSK